MRSVGTFVTIVCKKTLWATAPQNVCAHPLTVKRLKGSETVCEWVTGGAETTSDRKSLKEKIHSHTVKVSKCLLCGPCPLIWLVSPRWRPSHPDGAAPLQRGGAAAGEGHARVSGQQGLPLRLESGLEGGRQQQQQQQQQLGGEQEPRGAAEGRPLQLEQHPEAPCRPVEEGGLCDLWGHPGLPHSSLRDTEERPVLPVLTWLTGTGTLLSIFYCSLSPLSLFHQFTFDPCLIVDGFHLFNQ